MPRAAAFLARRPAATITLRLDSLVDARDLLTSLAKLEAEAVLWCNRRPLDTVAPEGFMNKARGLAVLHELAQQRCRQHPAARGQPHCLLNNHEPLRKQPQASKTLGIGKELLLHACGHVVASIDKHVHDAGRRGAAHEFGRL